MTQRFKCPDYPCDLRFTKEEMQAHLEWDHNRSEYKAEQMIADLDEPETCSRCSRDTEETTLSGERLCEDCQGARSEQHETREVDQPSLEEWSR